MALYKWSTFTFKFNEMFQSYKIILLKWKPFYKINAIRPTRANTIPFISGLSSIFWRFAATEKLKFVSKKPLQSIRWSNLYIYISNNNISIYIYRYCLCALKQPPVHKNKYMSSPLWDPPLWCAQWCVKLFKSITRAYGLLYLAIAMPKKRQTANASWEK